MSIMYQSGVLPSYEEWAIGSVSGTEEEILAVGSTGPVVFTVDNTIPFICEGVYCEVAQPADDPDGSGKTEDDRKTVGIPTISNICSKSFTGYDKIYVDHSEITEDQAGGATGTQAKMRVKIIRQPS